MGVVLHNGRIESDLNTSPDNKVYEVIRVIDKKPLFLKEHYERLENTLRLKNVETRLDYAQFKERTDDIIVLINKENFNIKVLIDTINNNDYFFENPSSYPNEELYKEGIKTLSFNYERVNPNAKVVNPTLTMEAQAIREEHPEIYELILVDSNQNITEGSKSNVFFTNDGILYTTPVDKVLPGITREEIIQTAKENDITVREIIIPLSHINKYEGAFISGTSPKILPIKSIDDVEFNVQDETIIKMMKCFDEKIKQDIENY